MREAVRDVAVLAEAAAMLRPDWRADAACAGMAVDEFFGDIPSADARAACARCPVSVECVAEEIGLPAEEICGMRGGILEGERRRLLARAGRGSVGGDDRLAEATKAFGRGARPSAVAERFGVSVRTAYRWREAHARRAG